MIFSESIKKIIHDKFTQNLPLGNENEKILSGLEKCSVDARVILELFYATMPSSDIGDYDFSLFKKYADFALFLAENPQWDAIPEDIFLNFVAYYRINNEAIEDCRPYFYNALKDRIKGKGMKEAALEVNVWCAEHATYQTTDERTASPLAILRTAYGRCGEESTLAVTAMRSVGIPARQVYTPRWAHCDDNHAWVEVWCGGEWYYLGACEPEPVLNRGWFNNAVARAMLVHARSFLPIKGEEIVSCSGQSIILNELARYARNRYFTVTLKNPLSVEGADVRFEMLNGSEFFPLATVKTDSQGKAGLTLGFGSVHIHAVKDGKFVEATVDTTDADFVTLDFSKAAVKEGKHVEDFDFKAPKDDPRNSLPLAQEQKELRKRIIDGAELKRKEYQKGFYQEEKAKKFAASFARPKEAEDILRAAGGNFAEIYGFLSNGCTSDKEVKIELLKSLKQKDLADVKSEVLEEHFDESLKFKNDFPFEIFVPYVMCPRISYEEISAYKKFILSKISAGDAELFKKQPLKAWEFASRYRADSARHNERLLGTPRGIMQSGIAGLNGRRILFVAIMRALGIPARLNPVDSAAQYYQNGKFNSAENAAPQDHTAKLTLSGGAEKWSYFASFTLGVLKNSVYQTLELSDCAWENGRMELALEPGSYRLMTSNRMPNGNQLARKYCFDLNAGETKILEISLRQAEIANLITDIAFAPFELFDENNKIASSDSFKGKTIFVWLEIGSEPTEHILNELIQAKDVLNKTDCAVVFILRQNVAGNETFLKARAMLPNANVYYSDFTDTAAGMARRMYADPESLPLSVAAEKGRGVYSSSGYNVGVVGLMIKTLNLAKNQ